MKRKILRLFFLLIISLIMVNLVPNIKLTSQAAAQRKEVMLISEYPNLLTETLNPDTNETYAPQSRKFQRMSSVIQVGSRIFAAWTAGGDTEPHKDNYIVVAYSDDKGATWVDPYMVIDPLDYQSGDKAQLPSFWINPDGLLFLFYSCNKSGYRYIVSNNADASKIEDVAWSEPKKSNSGGSYTKPTTLSNGTVLLTTQGSDPLSNPVYASFNKGISWEIISYTNSNAGSAKRFNESQIVELSNGSLMYLARLENASSTGGIEQSFSYDGGYTWTTSNHNLPYPLRGAGSRFYFGKLSNGNLVFVTNDSKDSTRRNLTIYLSEDDGVTWQYELLLDDRYPVSYPDLAEGKDGSLAIIYDAGGNVGNNEFGLCEMRLAYITVEDIKAGKIVNEASYIKGIIHKADAGIEIIEKVTSFENNKIVPLGTEKATILEALPTTINVIDENNDSHTFTGTWKTDNYNSKVAGKYSFYFEADFWNPKELQDNYSLLKVFVKVVEANPESNGCGCGSQAVMFWMNIALLAAGLLWRKKKVS